MSYGGASYGARAYAAGATAAGGVTLVIADALHGHTAANVGPWPESGDIDLSLVIDSRERGDLDLRLVIAVAETGTLDLPITIQVADAAILAATDWRPVIRIDGVDVTAQAVDQATIEPDEGAARIADITLAPPAGTVIGVGTYAGKVLTIDYARRAADGSAELAVRRFMGRISAQEFRRAGGTIRLTATDALWETLGRMDRDALASAIGGTWSPHVFDPLADSAQVARDRLSTVTAAADLDVYGNLRVTPWAAKASPDWVFDGSQIQEPGIEWVPARRDAIRNQIEIRVQYRYPRLWQQRWTYQWAISPMDWQDNLGALVWLALNKLEPTWAANPPVWDAHTQTKTYAASPGFSIPTRDMIRQAMEGTGWQIEDTQWVPPPPTQNVTAPPFNSTTRPYQWICEPVQQAALAFALRARLSHRHVQQVTEHRVVVVRSAASVAQMGVLADRVEASLASAFDAGQWASDPKALPLVDGSSVSFLLVQSGAGDPGFHDATDEPGSARADADTLLLTHLAIARARILASHRQGRARFRLPLHPFLDLCHTVQATIGGDFARGKVVRLRDVMDFSGDGGPVTEVELAISGTGAVGVQTTDPLAAPAPPAVPAVVAPPMSILDTYYGGTGEAAPAATATGYLFQILEDPAPGAPTNEHEFRVQSPPIKARDRDPIIVIPGATGTAAVWWETQGSPERLAVGSAAQVAAVTFTLPTTGTDAVRLSAPVGTDPAPAVPIEIELHAADGRPLRLVLPNFAPAVLETAVPEDLMQVTV